MNYSGSAEHIRMLRAWEADGVFKRTAQRQQRQSQPQRPTQRAPSSLAEVIYPKQEKDRGPVSPLGNSVW